MEPRIQNTKTEDGVNIAYATEDEGLPLIQGAVPTGRGMSSRSFYRYAFGINLWLTNFA